MAVAVVVVAIATETGDREAIKTITSGAALLKCIALSVVSP